MSGGSVGVSFSLPFRGVGGVFIGGERWSGFFSFTGLLLGWHWGTRIWLFMRAGGVGGKAHQNELNF